MTTNTLGKEAKNLTNLLIHLSENSEELAKELLPSIKEFQTMRPSYYYSNSDKEKKYKTNEEIIEKFLDKDLTENFLKVLSLYPEFPLPSQNFAVNRDHNPKTQWINYWASFYINR